MIDPSSFDSFDEQAILLLRFVALLAFLILFGGALSHARTIKSAAVRRASIAISALWLGFAYVQGAAIWIRVTGETSTAFPLSIALVSCGVALASTWAFWPWRREEEP
jgi:hypothetical protein